MALKYTESATGGDKGVFLKRQKLQKVPTYSGGSLTPKMNFAIPAIAGEEAKNIVKTVSTAANKIADKLAVTEGQLKGEKAQAEEFETGEGNYVGGFNALTLSGQAFNNGVNKEFVDRKNIEAETQIHVIDAAQKDNPDPVEAAKQIEEIKLDWMGTIPSHLQASMSTQFDKFAENKITQYDLAWRLVQKDKQKITATETEDHIIANIVGVLSQADWKSKPDYLEKQFSDLKISLENRLENIGQLPRDVWNIEITARAKILEAFITEEYKLADAKEKEVIKAQIRDGNYDWGELGEVFEDVLPGGVGLTGAERLIYYEKLVKLDETLLEGAIDRQTSNNKDNKNLYEKAENSFGLEYDNATDQLTYPPGLVVDVEQMKTDLHTELEIAEAVETLRRKKIVGITGFYAWKTSVAGNEQTINELQAEINDLYTGQIAGFPGGRGEYTDAEKEQIESINEAKIKKINDVIKLKEKAIKDKTVIDTWMKNHAWKLGEYNLETAEGWYEMIEEIQTNFGVDIKQLGFPKEKAQEVMEALRKGENWESYLQEMQNQATKYGELLSTILATGIKNSPEKSGKWSELSILNFMLDGNVLSAKRLTDANWNRASNENGYKKLQVGLESAFLKNAENAFAETFGDNVDITSMFGQAVHDTFFDIYYASAVANPDDDDGVLAIAEAQNFINDNFTTVTAPFGMGDVLMPKHIAKNPEEWETLMKEIITDPLSFNMVLQGTETYDDWITNRDNYYFVYENGGVALRMKTKNPGYNQTLVLQELPGSSTKRYYSDFIIQPAQTKKTVSTYSSVESTWDYDNSDNFNLKTFEKNWNPKKVKVEKGETIEILGVETGVIEEDVLGDKNLNDYIDDLTKEFIKKTTDEYPGTAERPNVHGVRRPGYWDKKVKNLGTDKGFLWSKVINFNSIQTKMQPISFLLSKGQANEKTIEWLAHNVEYFKHLKDPNVRADAIKQWNENLEQHKNYKTRNDTPQRMTPIQAFAHFSKQLVPNELESIKHKWESQEEVLPSNIFMGG